MKLLFINSGSGGNFIEIFNKGLLKKHKIFVFIYKSYGLKNFCIKKKIDYFFLKKTSKKNLNYQLFKYSNLVDPEICILFYNYILEKKFINNFRKIYNLHYTLLPKYKGLNGMLKSFESKNEYIGCTLHKVIYELDAGPIIFQKRIKNYEYDNENIKKNKLFKLGQILLKRFLQNK